MTDPTGFALADLLLGLGAAQEMERGGNTQKCPVCGFGQSDFKKTGRLGCATCYQTFAEGLTPLLKGMHKGVAHVGKVPSRLAMTLERESRLKDLHRELRQAVTDENYESAAQIRDRIRDSEKEH